MDQQTIQISPATIALAIAFFALVGPAIFYIGVFIGSIRSRQSELEKQVGKIWERIDERDAVHRSEMSELTNRLLEHVTQEHG